MKDTKKELKFRILEKKLDIYLEDYKRILNGLILLAIFAITVLGMSAQYLEASNDSALSLPIIGKLNYKLSDKGIFYVKAGFIIFLILSIYILLLFRNTKKRMENIIKKMEELVEEEEKE